MAKNQELTDLLSLIKFRKGLTQKQIAEELGVSPQYLSDLVNMRFEITDNIRNIIRNTYKDILTGEGEMLVSSSSSPPADKSQVPTISYDKGKPYYNVDFVGGFDLVMNDQTIQPEYYIDFAPYNKEGVIWCNATGSSMSPQINTGDIIAIKEIADWQSYLSFGEVYAIVTTNDLRTIKVIRKGSDNDRFRLVPINPDFDEQEIPIKNICKIFSVLGVIKKIG